jgi:CheY-like chemotaxis protein
LQVLLNLLSNAIKYNRPGGTVDITCERSAGTVSLSITDSGIGISPSNLAKLFTPFERLGAEHTPIEGTGVGLALSRLLSQQMGGSLTVSSEVGAGTTFTLELPALEAPTHEPHHERESTETAKASRTRPDARVRVLAIEDNVANLRVIERAMATLGGVDLITAVQGSLGMELARQHRPDLILLDLHLPDLPGNEVFNRLGADPATQSIPVVISSADATPGEAGRLLDAGAAAYLTKPIDLLQLFALVEQVRNGERIEPATLSFEERAEVRPR